MSDSKVGSGPYPLRNDMILVPILIRPDGITVRVNFPADLTEAEADKIARVIKAYATTQEKPSEGISNIKDKTDGN